MKEKSNSINITELIFIQLWENVSLIGILYTIKNLNLRQITGKRQSILASIRPIGAHGKIKCECV